MSSSVLSPLSLACYTEALRYLAQGYQPIRLERGTKEPRFGRWQTYQCTEALAPAHFYAGCNLGVVTGTRHPDNPSWCFISIDLDTSSTDDVSRDRLLSCVTPGVYPTRTGSFQHVQMFCNTDFPYKDRGNVVVNAHHDHPFAVSSINDKGKPSYAHIEIRGPYHQSMVPPSAHPNGWPMDWMGPPLHHYHVNNVPFLSRFRMQEILAILTEPNAAIHALHDAAPGTIHSSLISATGWMVNNSWPDQDISDRMDVFWDNLSEENATLDRTHADFDREWTVAVQQARRKFEDNAHPSKSAQADEGLNPKKNATKLPRVMAEWWEAKMGDANTPASVDDLGNVYVYQFGWWHKVQRTDITRVMLLNYTMVTGRDAHEAYTTLLSSLPNMPIVDPDLICCQTGTLNVRTLTVYPHSPEHGLLSAVPYDFAPGTPTPIYDQFMSDTFVQCHWGDYDERDQGMLDLDTETMKQTWEEFAGYSLTGSTALQSMLVFLGPTGSGKSTLAETIEWILPKGTVSGVALSNMSDARNHPHILSSRVNISYETGVSYGDASDFINSTAAGDTQSVRRMREESYSVQATTKLMFLGNRIMKTADTSGAIQRRMVTILAPNKRADASQRDITLSSRIRTEASGIFTRYVEAGNRVLERKRFLPSFFSIHALQESRDQGDSCRVWYLERCEYSTDVQMPNAMLYFDYQVWSKDRGFRPMNIIEWGTRLSGIGDHLRSKQARIKGTKGREVVRPIKFQDGVVPNLGTGGGQY